jgi:hypothetical protein
MVMHFGNISHYGNAFWKLVTMVTHLGNISHYGNAFWKCVTYNGNTSCKQVTFWKAKKVSNGCQCNELSKILSGQTLFHTRNKQTVFLRYAFSYAYVNGLRRETASGTPRMYALTVCSDSPSRLSAYRQVQQHL